MVVGAFEDIRETDGPGPGMGLEKLLTFMRVIFTSFHVNVCNYWSHGWSGYLQPCQNLQSGQKLEIPVEDFGLQQGRSLRDSIWRPDENLAFESFAVYHSAIFLPCTPKAHSPLNPVRKHEMGAVIS